MKGIIEKFLIVIAFIILPIKVLSQENQSVKDSYRAEAVKVFLDCRNCDMNYTRQEIPYINYVRDVREAEVFILVTTQHTGSGGRQYTYTFQGQGKFEGLNDTLTYTSSPDETNTITREKRTDMLKMGLMRYVAKTPLFNEIEISHNENLESEEVVDRWKNWVFSLSTEPQFESEEASKRLELRNSINITKITPDIKLEIEMDHFNLRTDFLPSVEYDIYPYSEATHRQLRILYGAGLQVNNYIDSTVYNKVKENLFLHRLDIAFQIQKTWGSINLLLRGSNYFHDLSKNRIELNSSINIRIVKGLSIRINGGIAHINDQLSLKMGDISEAERLLQLRELATTYRIEGGIELTYTFGSIYNNVVNPRFSSSRFRFY
jgi:hypothetical protein